MKNKFKAAIFSLVISLGIGGIAFPSFLKLNANAEGIENYFSNEEYTNDDKLLKSDGSLSTKTITQFSNEVKNAISGADCSEITQVIPRQCLEATETSAVYQHNGAEYGFYMVKEGNFFDLLLIDFVYEFENGHESDIEYKIRIEPILQQSFIRSQTSTGSYEWRVQR